MTDIHTGTEVAAYPEVEGILADMRAEAARGEEHWFLALLGAVRRWPLSCETVAERRYEYLVAGEAFDWLLLAERLCAELADLVPEREVEDLLFHGRFPADLREDEFQRLLGAKYRAHLNFVYGVRVEEALQYGVESEVAKERLSRVWENGHIEDEVFARIYGYTKPQLLTAFRREMNLPEGEMISLSDYTAFTYWLFKYRVRTADPARVASDTRKGLTQLRALEALRTVSNGSVPEEL